MIKINLVSEAPTAAVTKRRRPEISLGARQGDVLLVVALLIGVIITGGHYYILDREFKQLKQVERERRKERDELQVFIQKVQELEKKRDVLKHKIDVINNLKQNQRGPVRIMDEVSRALPELVWLTQLELKGDRLTLRGMAMDENNVANYIANLDSSPFFQEPSLREIRRRQEVFQFILTCVFTYAPRQIEGSQEDVASGAGT